MVGGGGRLGGGVYFFPPHHEIEVGGSGLWVSGSWDTPGALLSSLISLILFRPSDASLLFKVPSCGPIQVVLNWCKQSVTQTLMQVGFYISMIIHPVLLKTPYTKKKTHKSKIN